MRISNGIFEFDFDMNAKLINGAIVISCIYIQRDFGGLKIGQTFKYGFLSVLSQTQSVSLFNDGNVTAIIEWDFTTISFSRIPITIEEKFDACMNASGLVPRAFDAVLCMATSPGHPDYQISRDQILQLDFGDEILHREDFLRNP